MLAADAFPLVWAMPDVPPIHWGYNAAYIGEQQPLAGPPPGSGHGPIARLVPRARSVRRLRPVSIWVEGTGGRRGSKTNRWAHRLGVRGLRNGHDYRRAMARRGRLHRR